MRKVILVLIPCMILMSSCEFFESLNKSKTEKEKLVEAFKLYVEKLDSLEFSKFDEFKTESAPAAGGDFESYYEINTGTVMFKNLILTTKESKQLSMAERNLEGQQINMDQAKRWTKHEHDRRMTWRGINDGTLERSVYFSRKKIDEWLERLEANDYYKDYKPVGYRAYFSAYPNEVRVGTQNYDKDMSTIVLRAMYMDSNGKIQKIEKKPGVEDVDENLLTFNLGGLCPPKCFYEDNRDSPVE